MNLQEKAKLVRRIALTSSISTSSGHHLSCSSVADRIVVPGRNGHNAKICGIERPKNGQNVEIFDIKDVLEQEPASS